MSHDLTRWIEDADARSFSEAAMFDRRLVPAENHYLHLGDTIANISSWLRQGVSHESLSAIGCHALAHLRPHPHDREHH